DVADEVAREVVGLEAVEEDRLPGVGGGVQVTVDQAGRHELAGGVHAAIDRSVESRTDVDDAVVLEHDAPVRNQLVAAAVEADDPSALDQCSHRRDSWWIWIGARQRMLGGGVGRVNVVSGVDTESGAALKSASPLIGGARHAQPADTHRN